MKKIVLATASIAAGLLGGQALAKSGYVGAAYSSTDVDGVDGDAWGVELTHSFAKGPGMGFAVDLGFADAVDSNGGDVLGGTAHLFSLQEGSLFGGFVSAVDSGESATVAFGGEAQAYLSQATIGAAVSYITNDDVDVDGFGINAAGRFFATDNFAIGANVGWFTLESGSADADAIGYGVGAEYQLSSTPVSLLASYNRYEADDADIEADTITVGVRYNWGGTLKERDANGGGLASLSGISSLRF